MLCYHGTTLENLQILLNGDKSDIDSAWTCSDSDDTFYVWPLNKVMTANDIESKSEAKGQGIQQAFEAGQIQAAMVGKSTKIVVLELDIYSQDLQDDYSCDTMAGIASFIDSDKFDVTRIKRVFVVDFNHWISPMLLSGLLDNHQFNQYGLDDNLRQCAEAMRGIELDYDSMLEFDYSETTLENL
jgi:hypothetical protein